MFSPRYYLHICKHTRMHYFSFGAISISAQTPHEPEFHFKLTRRCQTAEPVECGGAAGEVTWACGISRSAEPVLLSPWGSLTQDLKSINLLAIKNTSKLLSLN